MGPKRLEAEPAKLDEAEAGPALASLRQGLLLADIGRGEGGVGFDGLILMPLTLHRWPSSLLSSPGLTSGSLPQAKPA
jgi:hypothetical protein